MHGKEFVNCLLSSYFTLVTLISVIMLVLGLHFYPDASFGYIAYAAPLLYGAYGTLTNVVMYSRHELSTKEFLIRKGIQLVLVEIVVLSIVFGGEELNEEVWPVMIALAIGIFVVYVLSHVVDWIQSLLSAKKMTQELIRFQERVKIEE